MEARLVSVLPKGEQWQYEPKFDGFRCIAYRDGSQIELRSKSGQPFNRYFPEIVNAVSGLHAPYGVFDGELVMPEGEGLSFDRLLLRIHPAASRVQKLASEQAALFVVFDLLGDERGRLLVERPFAERRTALERFFRACVPPESLLRLAPQTREYARVNEWVRSLGGGLDGIMAKRLDLPYQPGERTGMQKWKCLRTADCVVGGFRYAAAGGSVGSLLLGLYDAAGLLDHVGFAANLRAREKPSLTKTLERLIEPPGFTGQSPGGASRWSSARSNAWQPLAPRLVVEVQFDHFSGGRFRHGTRLLRWRPDKLPHLCTLAQVEQESRGTLDLLGA